MADRLHLTWQDSAAGALSASLPAGSRVYCTNDRLSFGCLPSTASLEAWIARRTAWLRRRRNERPAWVAEALAASYGGLQDALNHAEEITAWVGNSLNDELFVCWSAWLAELPPLESTPWNLRRFSEGQSDGRDVQTIGGMSPDEVGKLADQRFSEEIRKTALAGWRAVTSESPADLIAFLDRAAGLDSPGSHLEPIVGYFPGISSGLDVWEEALLTNLSEYDDTPLRAMGRAISERVNGRDLPRDVHLCLRLLELSDRSLDNPLVRLDGTCESMRTLRFEVTDLGRRVLDGKTNLIDTCGLNRWIGGVHLDSEEAASMWRRTPEGLRCESDAALTGDSPQPRETPSVDTMRVAEFEGHEDVISFTIYFEDGNADLRYLEIKLSWPESSSEAVGYESKYAWRLDGEEEWSVRKWIGATRWTALTDAMNELYLKCEDRLMVQGVDSDHQRCYRRNPTEHDVEPVTLERLFGGALNPLLRS